MVRKKYADDFRLENVLDTNGKLKTKAVYRGKWFRFRSDSHVIERTKRIYTALAIISVLVLLAMLFTTDVMGNFWYVVMPLACNLIPVFFVVAGCWQLLTAKDRVTREHKDQIHDRLAPASMFQTVFALLGVVGGIVSDFRISAFGLGRALFLLGGLVLTAAGLFMFLLRKNLLMEETAAE